MKETISSEARKFDPYEASEPLPGNQGTRLMEALKRIQAKETLETVRKYRSEIERQADLFIRCVNDAAGNFLEEKEAALNN